jgi:AcrR family transcriptional regulator
VAPSKTTPWRGDPLPRGRHKLSTEEVRSSQRERIIRAMLELVGERGYAATSVPDVVKAARVSRSGFYALFDDKLDCWMALLDELSRELFLSLADLRGAGDIDQAIDRGVRVYLSFWRERPLFARAYLVELPAAGEAAIAQREQQYRRFEELFAALASWAREEDPALPPLNPFAPYLVVGGITEIIAREVRAGRIDELEGLHGELAALVKSVLV